MLAMVVLMARRVVTQRFTRAGACTDVIKTTSHMSYSVSLTDLWSIQNENQETITIIIVGR